MTTGWETKTLSEVCDVTNGGTPKTGTAAYWDGPHQWLTPAEMGSLNDPHIGKTRRTITDEGLAGSSAKLVPVGSVILSTRAPIGHLAINEVPMAFNQGCRGLVPKPVVDAKYLYHFLDLSRQLLNNLGTGTTFKELSATRLKSVPIPLPPLDEQKRIVAILDAAFADIDQASVNTEGTGTAARSLLQSALVDAFAFSNMFEGADTVPLQSLCELIVDCEHKTAPTTVSGYPLIRTPNIGFGVLDIDSAYRVDRGTYDAWTRRAVPRAGDLVMAREAPAGNVGIVPSGADVCLGQRTLLIRTTPSTFIPEFLALFILHPVTQDRLLGHARGATVQHVNMKDIRALPIGAIPTLTEQMAVVERFEQLRFLSASLGSMIASKQELILDLRQSLLHQAFSGQL